MVSVLFLLTTCAPPPTVPVDVTSTRFNKNGIHLLLDDGRHQWPPSLWADHLIYARNLIGENGYVTQLIRLDDLDPAKWQPFFDLCATYQLIPILRLATSYDTANQMWLAPPADPDGRYHSTAQQYADFIAALEWPIAPHYVIVGNEPNHGEEWGGRPDPAAYARFLIDVSAALRQADPAVQILNAPLDPFTPHTNGQPFANGMVYLDAESFMDGMIAAEPAVFATVDIWASHSYPLGPFTEPPWQQTFQIDYLNGATNPNHLETPIGLFHNRGVNGYQWELFKLESYGITIADLPVMITETDWRHAETTDPKATNNGRPLPLAETVATYVDLAMYGNNAIVYGPTTPTTSSPRYPNLPIDGWTPWKNDPRVIAVTFFALNGPPSEWGHTNWLQLDENGRILDTYPILDAIFNSNRRTE